jgi:hypothetical protein
VFQNACLVMHNAPMGLLSYARSSF